MQEISIVASNANFIQIESMAGSRIDDVCAEAISLATSKGIPVRFNFNGVELEATASVSAEDLTENYNAECKRRHEEWKQSDEGKRFAAEQTAKIELHQANVDALLQELPQHIKYEDETVRWIGKFTEHADFCGVEFDKILLASQFESAGYIRNDCVDHPEVSDNHTIFARWLIGQVLDFLHRGLAPHPVAMKFAADYAAKFPVTQH